MARAAPNRNRMVSGPHANPLIASPQVRYLWALNLSASARIVRIASLAEAPSRL
jgi:hypothetical protein